MSTGITNKEDILESYRYPVRELSVIKTKILITVYFRETRVITASKPYSLGVGSVRKHCIPMSAIPCYNYRYRQEAGRGGGG
jgi:hypothetical protein